MRSPQINLGFFEGLPVAVLGLGRSGLAAALAFLAFALGRADLSDLAAVREEWARTRLVLATTTESALLGFQGASASLADHGVVPEVTQRLETQLGELTDRVNAILTPPRDRLAGGKARGRTGPSARSMTKDRPGRRQGRGVVGDRLRTRRSPRGGGASSRARACFPPVGRAGRLSDHT